ncbi:glycosyltransferase family 4 protein [Candidatus Gottesmanbacteria bacterium]|nr:glycosyltransferase family 4 protein [Candidatus Gottesmanbacteria bacterium]
MRILITIEYFYPHIGGVERAFLEISRLLTTRGHKVYILTTQENPSLKTKFIIKEKINGIEVVRLNIPNFGRRYIFPLIVFPLMFILFSKVDIVHSANNYTISLPSFLFARLTGKPISITVWEIWHHLWLEFYPPFIGIFFWAYERLTLSLPFNMFISPSRFVYNQLKSIPINKKIVIYPAGKNLHFSQKARAKFRKKYKAGKNFLFVYYGRFAPNKGVENLIHAHSKALKKLKKTKLFLFIPQPEEKITHSIHKIISKTPAKNLIFLYPGIPEQDNETLTGILSMADAIVIPDKTAAFGLSALESSEMEKPIVITKTGAFPEVVSGKVVFVDKDSIESLKDGLIKVYNKKWQIIPPKKFSWKKTAIEYEKIFLSLTSPKPTLKAQYQ